MGRGGPRLDHGFGTNTNTVSRALFYVIDVLEFGDSSSTYVSHGFLDKKWGFRRFGMIFVQENIALSESFAENHGSLSEAGS